MADIAQLDALQRRVKKAMVELQDSMTALSYALGRIDQIHLCDKPSIRSIQEVVSAHYVVTPAVMVSKIRTNQYAWARQVAMYLCRVLTKHSFEQIAKRFGNRDHGTVIYACKAVKHRCDTDQETANEIAGLTSVLRDRLKSVGANLAIETSTQ